MSSLFAVAVGVPSVRRGGRTVYDLRVPCSRVTQGQAVCERPVCPEGPGASVRGQGAAGIGRSTEPRLLEARSSPEQGCTRHTCARTHVHTRPRLVTPSARREPRHGCGLRGASVWLPEAPAPDTGQAQRSRFRKVWRLAEVILHAGPVGRTDPIPSLKPRCKGPVGNSNTTHPGAGS